MIVSLILLSLYLISGTVSKKAIDPCQLECPQNSTKVVCGSDDKEYPSQCNLKKSSCLLKNNVTLQYRGKCDCPASCPKRYRPICARKGTTEKTFSNICRFRKHKCKEQNTKKEKEEEFQIVKKGPCKPWRRGTCPEKCRDIWAPVCGTDGQSYSSICSLKYVSCKSETRIGLAKIGYCGKRKCPSSCPENFRPVCSNTRRLFVNECELRLEACRTNKLKDLKRAKRRLCKGKCIESCPSMWKRVCGSDGNFYENLCVLKRQNCLKKLNIKVAPDTKCIFEDSQKYFNLGLFKVINKTIQPTK